MERRFTDVRIAIFGAWCAPSEARHLLQLAPGGAGMIGLTEALITLAVFVGPPLLIAVATFGFLFRN
jgi:hypothetical protein